MQNSRYIAYRLLYSGLGSIILGVLLLLFAVLLPDVCLWWCPTSVPQQVFAPTDVPRDLPAESDYRVEPDTQSEVVTMIDSRPVEPVRFNGNCSGSNRIVGVEVFASDYAPQSQDDAGNPTYYYPNHTLDCRPDTSWRTVYRGDSPWLEYTFNTPVILTTVLLKPGYDKSDPLTGRDRWYQNWRVRSVRFEAVFVTGGSCILDWYDIADAAVMQAFSLEQCVGSQEVSRLRMTITDAHPPQDSDPRVFVAISDMMFEGFIYE